MPAWPESLPQCVLLEGYRERPSSGVLSSEMDVGPAKTRRRSTATTTRLPVMVTLSNEQLGIFEDWFNQDVAGGALPFDWERPRTHQIVQARIVGDPPYELRPLASGSEYWRLSMTLEIQP